MLDFIGTILIVAAMAVVFGAVVFTIPLSLQWRLTLAGAIGAWIGLVFAIVLSGHLGLPEIGFLFAFPLLVAAGLALWSPAARAAMLAVPLPLVIRLNAFRVLGVFFLLLAGVGRLGGPFPYFAGIGDIITGVFAFSAASAAISADPRRRVQVAAWNVFGALDLVVAVTLGVTSQSGSPIQLIHSVAGAAALTALPWAFIPTVLVPFFLIAHGVVFAHLRRSRSLAGAAQGQLGLQRL